MTTSTQPQHAITPETLERMRRPEHALWMKCLALKTGYQHTITEEMLPDYLDIPISQEGGTETLMEALAQAAGTTEDPNQAAGHFDSTMPKPQLSHDARIWLDQPENADAVSQLMTRWSQTVFTAIGAPDLDALDNKLNEEKLNNPLTRCLPRHQSLDPDLFANQKPKWRLLTQDAADLLSQYTGISFESPEEAQAFWAAARNPYAGTALCQWAADPDNRGELRNLVKKLGTDGHSVYRPNISEFAQIPEEALGPFTRVHQGIGSNEPGIYGLELMKGLANTFHITTSKIGRGFAMRDLNRQMEKLLGQLDEAEASK